MSLAIPSIRRQFPYLRQEHPPVYLDSAATAQKPDVVIDALADAYELHAANPHRGVHAMTEDATTLYERARAGIGRFIGAEHTDEIVFVRNATEGINLVAHSWAKAHLTRGDRIVLPVMEHHANIVPWMQLHEETGTSIDWIDIDDDGKLRTDELERTLRSGDVRLLSITGQSNVLGTRPDLSSIIPLAHACGAKVLVDAAQLAAHEPVDVQELDCDFLVFSGHKLYGPSGIGVLYAKRDILREMPPFLGGGMMIREVTKSGYVPADPPHRFEAGTMPMPEAVALTAALDWITSIPADDRADHEERLIRHAIGRLGTIDHLRMLGSKDPREKFGCISFVIDGIHPHDLTDALGQKGFMLRAGNHCAQILHERLGVTSSARMSFGLYNTIEEIDACIAAIEEIQTIFR